MVGGPAMVFRRTGDESITSDPRGALIQCHVILVTFLRNTVSLAVFAIFKKSI